MYDNYDSAVLAGLAVLGFVFFLIAVAAYAVTSFFLMKIFDKAGVQGKWRAWVPVYNFMVFSKLGDMSPWVMLIAIGASALLSQVPALGVIVGFLPLVVGALVAWRVGLKLQKESPWVVLFVLLSLVWLGINAFDKSRWNPVVRPAPWAGNAFFADSTVWAGVPVQPTSAAGPVPPAGYAPAPGNTPPAPPAGYAPPAPPAPPSGYAPPQPPTAPEPPAPSGNPTI
ncbi:large exoprotein [Microbacterium sp.]|uniref:large exoprotein n=1 Tax=Microbacterium sp. TaxID=51671 RepID=UPI0025F16FF4|nr:large exoprotein [Microbacterium sp.]